MNDRKEMSVVSEVLDTFKALTKRGDHVEVEPVFACGPFVVHPRVGTLRAATPGWTITHRPSGLAVWHTKMCNGAVKISRWLDDHACYEGEYLREWWSEQTAEFRLHVGVSLAEIAPFYKIEEE